MKIIGSLWLLKLMVVVAMWIQFAFSTHSENALSISIGGTVAIFTYAIVEPLYRWFFT